MPESATPPPQKPLNSIQCLRALAASLIVIYHIQGIENVYGDRAAALLGWFNGGYGVDIFFVISGFIMIYVTLNKPFGRQPCRDFLRKRLARIVPAYWFYTALTVGLLLFLPRLFRDTTFDLVHTLKSFLFIPDSTLPVVAVGWTLNYEIYFYLLFALFLLLPRRCLLPGMTLVFGGSVLAGLFVSTSNPLLNQITNPLLLEFLLGVYIGYHYLTHPPLVSLNAWALVLGGSLLIGLSFFFQPYHRLIYWGLPGTMIVLGAVELERCGLVFSRPIARLGDSSYSLYLTHAFTLNLVGRALIGHGLSGYSLNLLLLGGGFAASVLVGIVSYYLVERPSLMALSPGGLLWPVRKRLKPSADVR